MREDLRLYDNPALHHAASNGEVTPVYIFPEGLSRASYWRLHHSLKSLQASLAEQGDRLILRTGEPVAVLAKLCQETQATSVVWNRVYSPDGIAVGTELTESLSDADIESKSFNAQLLIEPTQVLNKQGSPFKVFTPFEYSIRFYRAINSIKKALTSENGFRNSSRSTISSSTNRGKPTL